MPFASGPTELDVPVSKESFTTNVENSEVIETCRWYFVAPAELPQLKVSVVDWRVPLLDGEESVGADGFDATGV